VPNPWTILFKAALFLLAAAVLFQVADKVDTVKVTTLSGGEINLTAVSRDAPVYTDEVDRARKKALPIYGLSVIAAVIGVLLVRKSYWAHCIVRRA
jgi:prepilin signal peptidase PulO-like enzyme (type II secretory pathway)